MINQPFITPRHQQKLVEALLYLKDHNVYACDPGNTFLYTCSDNGSAILAHIRTNLPRLSYNSAGMACLPSQRAIRSITHSGRAIDFQFINQVISQG